VKITVDTNVLVRGVVRDDVTQAKAVDKILKEAALIAVPLACLCEFVWVLRRVYSFDQADIAIAIQALLATGNVVANRAAVEAGLALLEAGGDFADGVIAFEGAWLGGETFVSFDTKAVTLLSKQGEDTRLLSQL
jgi:predicted nucleic-acid-binding protein